VSVSGQVNVNVPGSYTVTYSATNRFLTTTVERTVIVSDTIAPVIQGLSLSPTSIWPPDHTLVDVVISYVPADASGVAVCAPAVSSNQPVNGKGDGSTNVDMLVIDAHHVQLRAERTGGRDRVYTVTLTCKDASGNAAIQSRQVTVVQ
jgi:Domain of unknown function (DUF5011)